MKQTLGLMIALMMVCSMIIPQTRAHGEEQPLNSVNHSLPYHAGFDFDRSMTPFWSSNTSFDESVLMVSDGSGRPEASLLHEPDEILSVTDMARTKEYVEGIDWYYDAASNKIKLTEDSTAPYLTTDELYPLAEGHTQPKVGGGYVLFHEGLFFQNKQLAVTYTHTEQWQGMVPMYDGNALPKTTAILGNGDPLRIVLYGDSIAAGSNASGAVGEPPYMPSWGSLVVKQLERKYDSSIELINRSVGGKQSSWGASQVHDLVTVENPDLVIIAFGMNDGSAQVTSQQYKSNIESIMDDITTTNPNAEFILVSPTLANSETFFAGNQADFLVALQQLVTSGVAIADMSSVHAELLQGKSFLDMTGNNINHPNDYLVRWYAQVLSAILVSPNVQSTGTTYYISSSTGSDTNSGQSVLEPWKNISKLNATVFSPGDHILFKRGDTWSGESFYPQGNGDYDLNQWITVSTYGTGNRPILSPGNSAPVAIQFDRDDFTGGWKLIGLDIRDAKMGIDAENMSGVAAKGLWIENCTFYNITGNSIGAGSNSGFSNDVWASEGLFALHIDHITLKDSIFSYSDLPFDIREYHHVLIDNVTVDHTFRGGMWFSGTYSSDLTVQNSHVWYAGFRDGMTWGIAGIQLNGGENIVIQDTEVAYTQAPSNSPDGVAIDVESDTIDVTIQRVYLHDNYREAFLIMENSGWGQIGRQSGTKILDSTITNNGLIDPATTANFIRVYNYNLNNDVEVSGNSITMADFHQRTNWMYDLSPQLTDDYPSRFVVSNNVVNRPENQNPEHNVAKDKVISASSSIEAWGFGRSNLVDGIRTSEPSSMGYTSSDSVQLDHTEWVMVDLGDQYSLSKVTLYPRSDGTVGDGFPKNFTLQVSTDQINWTTVAAETNYSISAHAGQPFDFTAQTARYVKLEATSLGTVGSEYRLQLAEMEVYTREPVINAALNKNVSASSSIEAWGFGRSNLVDGIRTSEPSSMGYTSSDSVQLDHTEWVMVDLGDQYSLSKVTLYPRSDGTVGDGFPKNFTLQVSTDQINWMTVAAETNYSISAHAGQPFDFTAQTARYVKLEATSLGMVGPEYRLQLAEMEVYSSLE